jgi:hypothetical protein
LQNREAIAVCGGEKGCFQETTQIEDSLKQIIEWHNSPFQGIEKGECNLTYQSLSSINAISS